MDDHSEDEPHFDVPAPAFATIEQAAAYVGLTKWELWRLRRDGGGPVFIAYGVRVRYPWPELIAWANSLPRFTSIADRHARDPNRARNAGRQNQGAAYARKAKQAKRAREADDGQTGLGQDHHEFGAHLGARTIGGCTAPRRGRGRAKRSAEPPDERLRPPDERLRPPDERLRSPDERLRSPADADVDSGAA